MCKAPRGKNLRFLRKTERAASLLTSRREARTSHLSPLDGTSLNSKRGDRQFGAQARQCHCSPTWAASALAPDGAAEEAHIQPAPNRPPGRRGVSGKGRGEGWTRRCHFNGATPCATSAPGPRCHVPASVHRHILGRPPDALPCGRPSRTTPRASAAREQLERLEPGPPRWPPQNPARVRPGAASDCPGARQAPRGQAWAPPARPATLAAAARRRLTSDVSKAHIRRHPAGVSAPLASPGPPRRSAPLPSAAGAPLRAPHRPAPPRHVRSRLGARGHSVTHGGGARSMRGSVRAAGRGCGNGDVIGAGPRPALTSSCRRPVRRRPQKPRSATTRPSVFPKTRSCSGSGAAWRRTGLPVFQPPRSFNCTFQCKRL